MNREKFRKDLEDAINRNSMEEDSDTPDFLLAEYLVNCLSAYERVHRETKRWHQGCVLYGSAVREHN